MYHYEMTAIGLDHEHQGMPCQDHVTTFRWNGVTAQVCVDGKDGAEARILSEELAQNMAIYFHLWNRMPDGMLAAELLHLIRHVQRGLEACGGCTLVAAAMDARTHEYLGVSLGDGIMLARESFTRQVVTILPPERRADGSACSTGDEDEEILRHVRVARGRAKDALIISTDGLENTLWDEIGGNLSPTLGNLMKWVVEDPEGLRTDFTELVYDLSLADDAGLAVMVSEAAGHTAQEDVVRFGKGKPIGRRSKLLQSKRPADSGHSRPCRGFTRDIEDVQRRWILKAC